MAAAGKLPPAMPSPIVIIGAGISRRTTALTLKQKGFSVAVLERAAELKPVGAGIILASNAMQVLKKLGQGELVLSKIGLLNLPPRLHWLDRYALWAIAAVLRCGPWANFGTWASSSESSIRASAGTIPRTIRLYAY